MRFFLLLALVLFFFTGVPAVTSCCSRYGKLQTPVLNTSIALWELTEGELQAEYDRLGKEYTDRIVRTLVGTPLDPILSNTTHRHYFDIRKMSMIQLDEKMDSIKWLLASKTLQKQARLWQRVKPVDSRFAMTHCNQRGFLSASEAVEAFDTRFGLSLQLHVNWCYGSKTLQPACALYPGQGLALCTKECPQGLHKVVFRDDKTLPAPIPDGDNEFCCPVSRSETPGYDCRDPTACVLGAATPIFLEQGYSPRAQCLYTNLYAGVVAQAYSLAQYDFLKHTFAKLCQLEPECHRFTLYATSREDTFAVVFFRFHDHAPFFVDRRHGLLGAVVDDRVGYYFQQHPRVETFRVKDEPYPGYCPEGLVWNPEEQRCFTVMELAEKNLALFQKAATALEALNMDSTLEILNRLKAKQEP